MAENKNEENLDLTEDTDDNKDEDTEQNIIVNELHHGEELICHCHCVCCCESYEEAHPLPACLAPMCCCCSETPEIVEFACVCGNDDDCHNHVDQEEPECCCDHGCGNEDQNHVVEQVHACSVHCCDCGAELLPSPDEERRSPIPESLPSNSNNASRTPSPNPIDLDENKDQEKSIPQPPIPPPMPSVSNESSRMTVLSTTMTPMTLLKALSSDEGDPSDVRLHEAAKAGDVQKLRELLEEQSLVDLINSKIRPLMSTPLREAVIGGSVECIQILLSKGAEIDEVDIKGQTALFCAASLGLHELMEVLLKHGANPEGSSYNNCTPLLLCVRDGCTEGVQVLLKYGVDPQPVSMLTTCVPGWPLQHSIVYKHYGCFLALLKGGAETSLLRVIQAKIDLDKDSQERIDAGMVHRLSITRTVMRHARDFAEFLLTFREFGGVLEPLDNLPVDMKTEECPALSALKYSLDNPLSLKAQCRLNLCHSVGANKLKKLATSTLLPASLVDYLDFKDCYLPVI